MLIGPGSSLPGRIGLIVILGGALCAPSLAQEARPRGIEEIVVTAQKRSENIQDVPISMSALSSEEIGGRNIQSVADVTVSLPGVQFWEFSSSGNVSIRGVGTAIVSGAGEGSVAVHVDGVYLPQVQTLTMVQSDLERIEVLRGPQSTLYGRNSTGGVMNFISAAPTAEPEGQISLLYGNYERKQASGYVSGSLAENVRVRLSGQYQDRDGWTRNMQTGQDLEDLKSYGGRLAVDIDPNEIWEVQARVSVTEEEFGGPVYDGFVPEFAVLPEPIADFDPRRVSSPVIYDANKELTLISLRNTFDLRNVTLTSITGYVDFVHEGLFDAIGGSIAVPLTREQTNEDFSQEFNLSGSFDNLDWLVGLYYFQDEMELTSLTGLSNLGLADAIISQESKRKSYSGYTDLTLHLSERWRLYGGARLLREELDQRLQNEDSNGNVLCSASDEQRYRDTEVTGRIGAQYDVSAGVMAYGQYSRGFKTGGFSSSTCNNPFDPETIDAFELGIKAVLAGGRATINAAAFYYDYSDLQLEQATPSGIPYVNAPESSVLGVELNGVVSLTDWLRADFALSYLDAEYNEFVNTDPLLGVPPGTDLSGIPLNNSPEFSGTLGLEYDAALFGTAWLNLRGELIYSSEYNVREFDLPYTKQDEYTMLNAFATLSFDNDRYSIRAFGKNLTDRTIIAGVLGFGGALGSWQPPRTYGFEALVRF